MSTPSDPIHVTPGSDHLQEIFRILHESKKIVAFAGAGLSTAAGIPDYYSRGGTYADGQLFREAAFLSQQGPELLQKATRLRDLVIAASPTSTHRWLAALGSRLIRCYTQNLDMLEAKAGIETGIGREFRCVPLHGFLEHLQCHLCKKTQDWDSCRTDIASGMALPCPECADRIALRIKAGKRKQTIGKLRPDIAMSDISHPYGDEIADLAAEDCAAGPEVLLIIGTSLTFDGPRAMAKKFINSVQSRRGSVICINRTRPRREWGKLVDYWVELDCDDWIHDLLEREKALREGSPSNGFGVGLAWSPGCSKEYPIVID